MDVYVGMDVELTGRAVMFQNANIL